MKDFSRALEPVTTLKKISTRLILATAVVLSALTLFTQFIAYRFDFHPDLVYGYQEEIRELKSVNNRLEKEINLLRIKNEQIMKHRRDRYREAKRRLEKQAMANMRFDHLDDLRQYVREKLRQEGFSGQDECLLEERGR